MTSMELHASSDDLDEPPAQSLIARLSNVSLLRFLTILR